MRRLLVLALVTAVCAVPIFAAGVAGQSPDAAVASKKKRCSKRSYRRKHPNKCKRAGSENRQGGGDNRKGDDNPCTNTPASPGRVAARESEYQIVLSRSSVGCGTSIVEQDNFGEDPHDLVLWKAGNAGPSYFFPELGPGGVARQTLELGRGTWTLYCSLPGHYEAGMHVNLEVD